MLTRKKHLLPRNFAVVGQISPHWVTIASENTWLAQGTWKYSQPVDWGWSICPPRTFLYAVLITKGHVLIAKKNLESLQVLYQKFHLNMGVSNLWNGLWNGLMEWTMEWTDGMDWRNGISANQDLQNSPSQLWQCCKCSLTIARFNYITVWETTTLLVAQADHSESCPRFVLTLWKPGQTQIVSTSTYSSLATCS